ncbi:Glycosyltransferase family 2 protein [Rhodovastum atsumiense]|uniref:glycosyltransferase family 2 protein n=1 Tax=Rhodovastum atsumiense TaxID=504468 RepID=UPI00139F2AD3|nr:glycosyltransferase family A protein [Rhodovastum atsumiense]CAH2603799.1 Glycosyltransferase family 2 protein [Rhodovastum atsumiense]
MHIRVVMPAFNVAPWIGAALTSLQEQTHPDWSAVIVDDGSTDGTEAVVAQHQDPRIRLIRQANAGVSAARNRGLEEAGGDAVLFLDADDWLARDAMARLAAALGPAVAAYGPFCFVSESGALRQRKRGPFPQGDILERLLEQNLFANGGHMLIRRSAVDAAGRFRTDITYGEDWEFWIRVALHGSFVVTPGRAPLLFVRQRASGAYLRLAHDPTSFRSCLDAAFDHPALIARLGRDRLAALRARTEAENAWIIGRELIRHGDHRAGCHWLRQALRAKPQAKRAVLAGAAHMLGLLPEALQGPFRPYPRAQ